MSALVSHFGMCNHGGDAKNITKMLIGALANQGGLTPKIRDPFMAFEI